MATINSILAGFSLGRDQTAVLVRPFSETGQSHKNEGEDTFSRGKGELNKARVRGSGAAGGMSRASSSYGLPVAQASESGKQPNAVVVLGQNKDDSGKAGGGQSSTAYEIQDDGTNNSVNLTGRQLSEGEKQQLALLQTIDREVKAHERAHLAAAGGYARGGASFQYQQGPDGKKYAVGGEVSIDMGREASPEHTINKMRIVRNAALAPANPSSQDQRVAARATLYIAEAAQELRFKEGDVTEPAETEGAKVRGGKGEEEMSLELNFYGNQPDTNKFGVGVANNSKGFSAAYPSYGSFGSNDTSLDLFV